MIPNFNDIEDPKIKQLAIQIYDNLSMTGQITLFEILANDIYCQVGQKNTFVFSVEVRGNDAEFFLFDMNFILSNDDNFEAFIDKILTVSTSSINGDYVIETVKVGNIRLSSALIFQKKFKVYLYKNLFSSFLLALPSGITKHLKSGQAIIEQPIK